MLAKEITYTDLNGNQRTDTYYFNLTKAELIEYDAAFEDGVLPYLTRLSKQPIKFKKELVEAFRDLILRSYGEKTLNGRFVKSQELRDAFAASEAYSELFLEITKTEEGAANFINAIVPQIPTESAPVGNVTPLPAPVG